MVRLRKVILAILYFVSPGADSGCPSGLILTDAAYKRSLGTTVSSEPIIFAFKSYDPSIKDDAIDRLGKNMEREWTARLATQLLI